MPARTSLFLRSVFRFFRRRPDPSRCPVAPPPEPPEPQPAGLEAIPAVAYDGSQAASGEEEGSEIESCTICLMEFARGDTVRTLPNCGHTFHRDCIDEWLPLRSVRCPNCRHRTMETGAVEPGRPARCINGNRRNDDPSSSPLILNFGNGCGHISSYL